MKKNRKKTFFSSWERVSSRPAGLRQTLEIGDAGYGFCWIPAGEFDMGSPLCERGRSDVEVLHHATLTRGFWMLETPTTQALYKEVMGKNPSVFKGDDLPVEWVSWRDADDFCKTLTERLPNDLKAALPTETQWEYACRAGTRTAFWHGDSATFNKINFNGNIGRTTPVKTYAANPWGLYDMHGNVCEWCRDWYDDYPEGSVTDPETACGFERVCRGGSWLEFSRWCRSAVRFKREPYHRDFFTGFRFTLLCR